jgi:histidinol-phosphatase (PHP family)
MVFLTTMRDYHIHTSLCKHAAGEMFEYVESAIEKGIKEICFTDHIPFPGGFDKEHRMGMEEVDGYVEQVEKLKQKYPEIKILTGIEADYIERYEEFLGKFLSQYPFDLVIMSIHFVGNWPPGQWVFGYHFPDKSIIEIYHDYFDSLIQGIKTGLFDVVAHLDLIKKMNTPVLSTNPRDMDEILNQVSRMNMSIEVNTSGLRRAIAETYPSLEVVGKAAQKGIPVTLASDAHLPEQVGFHFLEILGKLSCFRGLKLARYRERKILGLEELRLTNRRIEFFCP